MNIKDKLLLFIKGSGNSSSEPKIKKVREKKITRFHLILTGFILLVALVVGIVIKVKIDTKDNKYHAYEKELVNSANIYYDIKQIKIKDGTTDRIDAQKLIDANLVNIDSNLLTKCTGYVESVSEKDYNEGGYKITRRAYIKCGNKYKSLNYVSYQEE